MQVLYEGVRKIDKDKCPKCKENYVEVFGGGYKRICKCNNLKMYEALSKSFEDLFKEEDNTNPDKDLM